MNILLLLGSPRKNGNTETLCDAFIEGAKESGHTVNKICLRDMKIGGCLGCEYCKRNDGSCIQKDDMEIIYPLITEADMLVLATPVYFFNMSAQLKAAVDRLYAKHLRPFKITKSALLAVAADEESVFASLEKTYDDIISYLEWQDMGRIMVPEVSKKGEIKGNVALEKAKELGKSL